MEIVVSTHQGVVMVEPKGGIDSTTSRQFGDRLLDLIKEGTARIVVDFSNVGYISSAGFRALLIAAKDSADRNCVFALCSLSREVRRLFEIGCFLDLFRIYDSREESIADTA
jgi:anti-anti-sigma factor